VKAKCIAPVVFDFCENYLDNKDLAEDFKKQNGWFDK